MEAGSGSLVVVLHFVLCFASKWADIPNIGCSTLYNLDYKKNDHVLTKLLAAYSAMIYLLPTTGQRGQQEP